MRCAGRMLLLASCIPLAAGCVFNAVGGGSRDQKSLMSRMTQGRDELMEAVSYKNLRNRTLTLVGLGPDEQIAQQAYKEGDSLFQERKYREAEKKYDKAAFRWPDSALEEDALFMQAECQFLTDRYAAAFDTYDKLLKKYGNSRHIDTVSKRYFAIGDYWTRLHRQNPHWPTTPNLLDRERPRFDTNGHARKAFQAIIEHDSTGPLGDDAVMQLANSYFLAGRYADAADYYEMLRHQYPDSEHQFHAHLLGLQCELNQYQGPLYDDAPLVKAEKLVNQLLAQFPDQLGNERDRVLQHRKEIDLAFAERDWNMAQYYEGGKKYRAARHHYQTLAERYRQTPFASQAEERLAQLQGKPDHVPNAFVRIARGARTLVGWGSEEDSPSATEAADGPPALSDGNALARQPVEGNAQPR